MNDTIETAHPMIASDRVEGTLVFNRAGERLGRVERFMVDKVSGHAQYAVMSFGGLFGIGNRHYPLPWKALDFEPEKGGYVVDVTKEQIEGAPGYDAEGEEPKYDRAYQEQVYTYYGFPYI